MEECLSHRWLIGTLRLSIKSIISSLERHLDKRIGGEPILDHPIATVSIELKRLTIVLANQVRNACLGKPNARAQLGGEAPLKFLRRGIEDFWRFMVVVIVTAVMLWRLVGLGVRRELGFKEGRSGGVDRACHQHETFGEDICREAKDGVSVNASVFKIDTRHAVSANDDLELRGSESGYDSSIEVPHLVVPPIRASADLNAVAELVRPAEIIRAQLGLVVRGEVVEAYHKECIVYGLETLPISRVRCEHFAEAAPNFAVLGREHTNRGAGDLMLWDLIRVGTDGLEIEENIPLG